MPQLPGTRRRDRGTCGEATRSSDRTDTPSISAYAAAGIRVRECMNEAPGNPRHRDERAVFAGDQQGTPDRLGRIDVFSGSESDGIAMTGEEDPLAEVDTDGF